jgi:hypothetical protein
VTQIRRGILVDFGVRGRFWSHGGSWCDLVPESCHGGGALIRQHGFGPTRNAILHGAGRVGSLVGGSAVAKDMPAWPHSLPGCAWRPRSVGRYAAPAASGWYAAPIAPTPAAPAASCAPPSVTGGDTHFIKATRVVIRKETNASVWVRGHHIYPD